MTSTTTTSMTAATTAVIRERTPAPSALSEQKAAGSGWPAHGCKADERDRGKRRGHGEHGCVGGTLGDEGEHEGRNRLHRQVRPPMRPTMWP